MMRFIRSRVWKHSHSPAQLVRVLRGRVSSRQALLFSAAVGRCVWWDLPYWLPGTEFENHIQRLIELTEGVADGIVSPEWDEIQYGAERVAAELYSRSIEGFGLRPVARIACELVHSCIHADLPAKGFPNVKPALVVACLRDIFGNPFRPVIPDPSWLTSTAVALARQMYESRDFSPMPILADALQDAGCEHPDILSHCRVEGMHARGCWVVDLVLGKT